MILVAGGSGFIGSAVVRRLAREGSEVAVMSAHPSRSRARIESMGASVIQGDVRDATVQIVPVPSDADTEDDSPGR